MYSFWEQVMLLKKIIMIVRLNLLEVKKFIAIKFINVEVKKYQLLKGLNY